LTGRQFFYKEVPGPPVVGKTIYKNVYLKDATCSSTDPGTPGTCKELKDCYLSELTATWKIEHNFFTNDNMKLLVEDDCKSVNIDIPIAETLDWKIKLGLEAVAIGAIGYGSYKGYKYIKKRGWL
jgi:hypothetical protein